MEPVLFISSVLMNIATIISVAFLIHNEQRKKRERDEQKHNDLIRTILEQKTQEYERAKTIDDRFNQLKNFYDTEIDRIGMAIEKEKSEKAIELEKIKSSIEKLILTVESTNEKISELTNRISEFEKFAKELYEFIGFTKGEKSAKNETIGKRRNVRKTI